MEEGKYFVDALGEFWVEGDKSDQEFKDLDPEEFKAHYDTVHYEYEGVHYYRDGKTMIIESPKNISFLDAKNKEFKTAFGHDIKSDPFGHCICKGLNFYRLKTLVSIKQA